MDPRNQAALTVACPTCKQPKGQPCVSRHAVQVHMARRRALADLEKQADQLLRRR